MKYISIWIFIIGILFTQPLTAQHSSIEEAELELAELADVILRHDSLKVKIQKNKKFSKILIDLLKKPESFTYPFDSLKSISILTAEDKSFRIFTWHMVDKNYKQYYGEQYHYYFGLVQRKYVSNGQTEYIVIPLLEMPTIPRGVENMVLDNGNWLGALYYPPRYGEYIPSQTLKYYSRREQDGSGSPKKIKQDFYVLMGWNGNDEKSNYKMIEVMSFDPDDKNRVIFGADVFYFDAIPKYRALFKYSEYAPFSLNYAYVKKGRAGKRKMIVYDHMGSPKPGDQKLTEIWEMGPDGSYDAIGFYKKGGYFEWYRNIELAEKYNNKITKKQQEEVMERERKKLEAAGIQLPNTQ